MTEPGLPPRDLAAPGLTGRVLALDLGERRIGVALCDPEGILASPYATIERSGDRASDHQAVATTVSETGAVRVVVGLPLSMSGRRGPAAESAVEEVSQLRKALGVPVEMIDERLTTASASRRLSSAGINAKSQRKGGRIDQEAAALILQAWLDGRRGSEK